MRCICTGSSPSCFLHVAPNWHRPHSLCLTHGPFAGLPVFPRMGCRDESFSRAHRTPGLAAWAESFSLSGPWMSPRRPLSGAADGNCRPWWWCFFLESHASLVGRSIAFPDLLPRASRRPWVGEERRAEQAWPWGCDHGGSTHEPSPALTVSPLSEPPSGPTGSEMCSQTPHSQLARSGGPEKLSRS